MDTPSEPRPLHPAPEGQAPPAGRTRQTGERDDILTLLANDVEAWFNQIEATLTDPEAARIYTHTIGFVGHVLDGAVAQGLITQKEREELAVLMAGLAEAPRHV